MGVGRAVPSVPGVRSRRRPARARAWAGYALLGLRGDDGEATPGGRVSRAVLTLLLLCVLDASCACAPAAAAEPYRLMVPLAPARATAPPLATRLAGAPVPLHGVAAWGPAAWAVGNEGFITATRDGGATWRTQREPQVGLLLLFAAAAASEQVAWAVGGAGLRAAVLGTRDGGGTWVRQDPGAGGWLRAVAAASPAVAWAVGDGGTIVATTDGGATWARQEPGARAELLGVAALTETQAVAVGYVPPNPEPDPATRDGDGVILATRDGGAHWATVARVPPPATTPGAESRFYAVSFATPAVGWAVGLEIVPTPPGADPSADPLRQGAMIYGTRDGGVTWTRQAALTDPSVSTDLYAVVAVSPTEAWAGGFAGYLVATRDGGASWLTVARADGDNYEGMAASQGVLWGVGDRTVRSGPVAAQAASRG